MNDRSSQNRAWLAVAALYVGFTIIYAWPLLLSLGSALPSDTGDPGLNTWIVWWNAHAIPLTARWWNAPIFFPVPGAFALSETFLGLALLTTPLQWAGASPVLAYNVAFLVSFPSAALAAHALARRLTGRHDAALIAGLAFGFSPYRASQMPHLQLLWSCWMPLGLLALHRFIDKRRPRDLALLALCWMLNGLATGYYLIFFAVLVGLWLVWFVRTRWDWIAIGASLVAATVVLAPLLVGYDQHQKMFGLSRSGTEIEAFSADLTAIWAVSPHAWLPAHWTMAPRPEGELYPGATILILTAIGLIVAWRGAPARRRSRVQIVLAAGATLTALVALASWLTGGLRVAIGSVDLSVNHPHKILTTVIWLLVAALLCDRRFIDAWRRRSVFLFYVLAAAVMFFLALGPAPHAFGERFMYKAPYAWLMELPGGHSVRVPARFAMLIMLCLAQAAAMAFGRLTRRGASTTLVACVAMAIAFEGWIPRLPAAPVPASVDLAGLDRDAVVMELPLGEPYGDTAAMLRAMSHGHAVVNGFSGYGPPHYALLAQGLTSFDPSVLPAMQQFGSLLVLVDTARDPDGRYREFVEHSPNAVRVRDTAVGPVYALPAQPKSSFSTGDAVSIASVAVSGNSNLAPLLTDGQIATPWSTPKDQTSQDFIRITLDRAATISAVELAMGPYGGGYPRALRVAVSNAGSAPTTVWEGRTVGLLVLGALRDFTRMPITIMLPANTRGDQIVLSTLEDAPKAPWAVAELRVFGAGVVTASKQ